MAAETDPEANLAEEAFNDAKRLAKEGDYAGALERHLWFHEHALTHQPSFYGVRLSFALGAWKDLCAKYPPALAALRGIRDRGTKRLYDGDPSDALFHDVVSLNKTLGERKATFRLFQHFESSDPEMARRRFRRLVDDAFVHKPELFVRYTPDLEKYLDERYHLHLQLKESFAKAMAIHGPKHPELLAAYESREKGMNKAFWRIVERLAGMARDGGRVDAAERLLARGREVLCEGTEQA